MKRILSAASLLIVLCSGLFAQTQRDSLTIVNMVWNKTLIEPGITHYHAQVPDLYKGQQNINIVEIDIRHNKKLVADIIATPEMVRTSETANKNGGKSAINGSFYNMKAGNSVCYYKQNGILVDTTSLANDRSNGVIRIHKGKLSLAPWGREQELKDRKMNKKETILASGPMMIYKGNVLTIEESNFNRTKHPRTAIATTKDNKLLLVTMDGRNKEKAIGVSISELAHLLKLLNAKEALNLDGGGSTTLWVGGDGGGKVLNLPSDKGGERKVANIVVVKQK